jgi:hypothetical protein
MSSLEESVKAEIDQALKGLPVESQQRVVRKMLEVENQRLVENEAQRAATQEKLTSYEALARWIDDDGPLLLDKNDCSRLHQFKAAGLADRFHIYSEGEELSDTIGKALLALRHTFVVKHNWASAFEGAQDFDGEIKLPYEMCAFEMRISGKTFIAVCVDDKAGVFPADLHPMMVVIESGGHWFMLDFDKRVMDFIWSQIRAACIALDAEVAISDVVRAPFKLNEKRKKLGKVPLSEYRVIDLARRHRVSNGITGSGEGTKKRLHFRRGHWRHYETHRTWIRWCLVGDPALGFIGKHYAL